MRSWLCEWQKPSFGLGLLLFVCVVPNNGQDAAQIARQEEARRASGQNSSKHVYTEEDLKRKVILIPGDRALAEFSKHQPDQIPSEQTAGQIACDSSSTTATLGNVARCYRRQKASR